MSPRTIDAHFKLITPAYLGGADDGDKRTAGLRVPSLLGVLRFWWRSLEWGRIVQQHPPAPDGPWDKRYAAPLGALRAMEDRLFGAAGKGQGLVLARLCDLQCWDPPGPKPALGAAYLAGQGLRGRGAVGAESTFTMRLTVRPQTPSDEAEALFASLKRALCCLGLLGGVGARNRHGFGSLSLQSIEDSAKELSWQGPNDIDDYVSALRTLDNGTWPSDEPPFTTFSRAARLRLIEAAAGTAIKSFMEQQGHLLQLYRSKGSQNAAGEYKINGVDARAREGHTFEADFDWFDALGPGHTPATLPARTIFGLPHNYFSGSRNNKRANINAVVPREASGSADSQRRASPLFLHFHKLGNGRLAAAWLFLPAVFLPNVNGHGPQLEVDGTPVDFTPDWWPIETFFDQELGNARQVLP